MLVTMPGRRQVLTLILLATMTLLLITTLQHVTGRPGLDDVVLGDLHPEHKKQAKHHGPKHKPPPKYEAPPIKDNFPLLTTSKPPPIPTWNQPRPDLHRAYDLPVAPPLLIGFTRAWPILLQAVTSYITAGWPADQIYVVENTGVQQANARGQLTLQNPFYMNHTQLTMLGVHIIQTPVLLSFAQLQNFYLSLTYSHDWPYFFWSHMDVVALSYEDGLPNVSPRFNEPGYKSLYELGLSALKDVRIIDPDRWGMRFFAYDHLALVNPAAIEDVGGWDTLIPYYITDCDMHSRLTMKGWTMKDRQIGIIGDTSSHLDDLLALYRVDGVKPEWIDPNPPALVPGKDQKRKRHDEDPNARHLEKFLAIKKAVEQMGHYKWNGERGRNTWQRSQHGGQGEPFYYDARGLYEGLEIITEAGKKVYRKKWGHKDCELIAKAHLEFDDQWMVEKDWGFKSWISKIF